VRFQTGDLDVNVLDDVQAGERIDAEIGGAK
jgi:hypothetical protein